MFGMFVEARPSLVWSLWLKICQILLATKSATVDGYNITPRIAPRKMTFNEKSPTEAVHCHNRSVAQRSCAPGSAFK